MIGGKKTYEPDPKPSAREKKPIRKVDRAATTRAVLKRRACAIKDCPDPAATGHHILARGAPYFGDDVEENIVQLCGSGTSGHHGLIENEDITTRRQLGEHIIEHRPDVIEYVQEKLGGAPGNDWLARRLFILDV